jgi:hypothetical protein
MSGEFAPVRAVFRGWREVKGLHTIKQTEHDGSFPSSNDVGAPGRSAKDFNPVYTTAKKFYGVMLSALLREPNGSEYEFIKPGTKGVKCIMPVEREGELPHGAGFMLVEGRCVYPTRQTRDQQNTAAVLWKFLLDVLENDGYLAAHDDWLGAQCGNLARGWDTSRPAYTELMFFPARDRLVLVDEGQAPPAQGTIL